MLACSLALKSRSVAQTLGLFLGPAAFLALRAMPIPEGLNHEAWVTAALAVLMVIWWVTEAIPIAATALAPLVVLPLAGVLPMRAAAAPYMSPIVVLLMAGFILAKAIERWNLHERIALNVVCRVGARPSALIAGFMIASAGLSMWISNTATALMMTPIALSVARAVLGDGMQDARFASALVLCVAYACSIGGLATPVGSPTNLIVIGYLGEQGVEVGFADWMRLGAPAVVMLLPLTWAVLCAFGGRMGDGTAREAAAAETVRSALDRLGRMTAPEARTLAVFGCVALAWMFRAQLQHLPGLDRLNDQIIAVAGAIAFFVLPSGAKSAPGAPLLDWPTADRIPWGVVLLFGGGLSLAAAISATGLAAFVAGYFDGLRGAPDFLVIVSITVLVLMLTEFTSNVATVSAILPMIGAVALATGFDLMLLAAPVGLAASCAFMLPMATGPNAVAYAAGGVSLARMARVGVGVNILAALVITTIVTILGAR